MGLLPRVSARSPALSRAVISIAHFRAVDSLPGERSSCLLSTPSLAYAISFAAFASPLFLPGGRRFQPLRPCRACSFVLRPCPSCTFSTAVHFFPPCPPFTLAEVSGSCSPEASVLRRFRWFTLIRVFVTLLRWVPGSSVVSSGFGLGGFSLAPILGPRAVWFCSIRARRPALPRRALSARRGFRLADRPPFPFSPSAALPRFPSSCPVSLPSMALHVLTFLHWSASCPSWWLSSRGRPLRLSVSLALEAVCLPVLASLWPYLNVDF